MKWCVLFHNIFHLYCNKLDYLFNYFFFVRYSEIQCFELLLSRILKIPREENFKSLSFGKNYDNIFIKWIILYRSCKYNSYIFFFPNNSISIFLLLELFTNEKIIFIIFETRNFVLKIMTTRHLLLLLLENYFIKTNTR